MDVDEDAGLTTLHGFDPLLLLDEQAHVQRPRVLVVLLELRVAPQDGQLVRVLLVVDGNLEEALQRLGLRGIEAVRRLHLHAVAVLVLLGLREAGEDEAHEEAVTFLLDRRQVLLRGGKILQRLGHLVTHVVGARALGIELERLIQLFSPFVLLALGEVRARQIEVRVGVVGRLLHRVLGGVDVLRRALVGNELPLVALQARHGPRAEVLVVVRRAETEGALEHLGRAQPLPPELQRLDHLRHAELGHRVDQHLAGGVVGHGDVFRAVGVGERAVHVVGAGE